VARLNVLQIVVDDQRFDTIGALGNDTVETPVLDALAERACSLRPYTTVPICTPARAELFSGCHAFANGCRWFGEPIDPGLPLLPETLSDAGYDTFFVGKWHQTRHPEADGFDEARRLLFGDHADNLNPYPETGHTMRFADGPDGDPVEGHSTELLTEPVLSYLEDLPEEPWFASVSYFSPHDPRTPPTAYADRYDSRGIPLPENYAPEHPIDTGAMTVRDELLEEWPRTPAAIRQHLANYYGLITHHDNHVGRILDALERTGQRENTIVVFTSDHGLGIGSHGLLGKQNMYDHSVRVPMLIDAPGLAGERLHECLCTHADWYPTLCDLLGIEPPERLTGRSYAPVLRGERASHRDAVCCAYRDVQRAIATERWKLITYPQSGRAQLFDRAADPAETRNLLAPWRLSFLERNRGDLEAQIDPFLACEGRDGLWDDHPVADVDRVRSVSERLRARLGEWQHKVGDPLVASEAASNGTTG
jgi:arylsulfatase A-like enzyme